MMNTVKSGDLVIVGQEIGHEAQYLGIDESTYLQDGKVLAAIPGFLEMNDAARTIRVDARNINRKTPKTGDIITGQIYALRRSSVGVKIFTINNRLIVDMGYSGTIHISKIAGRYIKNIDDVFLKFDFIRAEVINKQMSEFQLKCDKPHLGIIKSYCKFCGTKMERKGREQVICPFCNHTERKMMAADFNEIEIELEF